MYQTSRSSRRAKVTFNAVIQSGIRRGLCLFTNDWLFAMFHFLLMGPPGSVNDLPEQWPVVFQTEQLTLVKGKIFQPNQILWILFQGFLKYANLVLVVRFDSFQHLQSWVVQFALFVDQKIQITLKIGVVRLMLGEKRV